MGSKQAEQATILVVEDQPDIRRLLEDTLSDSYQVLSAEHGLSGLRAAQKHPSIVMVLTDLVMPELDGLELTRLLHTERPALPVVVMTAHDDRSQVLAALRAGAYDFLAKPFELDLMEAAVRRAVSHSAYQQLLFRQTELRGALATAMRAAHEINNPLLVIKSIAEFHLMYEQELPQELRDDLMKINGAVDALARQVRLLTQIRRVIVDDRLGFPLLDLEQALLTDGDAPAETVEDGEEELGTLEVGR